MFALYKFELRKIISRKIVLVTGCVMLVGLLIWGVASAVLPQRREYSDSSLNGYEANRAEHEAAELISGRAIDQTLIDEMRLAYEDFIFNGNYKEALPYLDVYNFIGTTLRTHASAEVLECDIEAFYERLNAQLEASTPSGLTESIAFADMMKFVSCMEIMFITICLSTVFTVEHTRKTDQIILCTRLGKKKLYVAKILAGLTVGIGFTLILSLLMLGIVAFLYGFAGYNTILQFVLLRPFNLTVVQAALILVVLSFAGAALVSLFTMMLSELTKNSVATIGTITGIMILTMFIMEMPANLKLLSEIWYLLPSNLVSLNGAFRYSVISVGSSTLAAYQYAPVVYAVLAVVFALIGKQTYNRYQINGR